MKKKLLFVMNHLHCGGAEKSLVSLLQAVDFDQYEVDLLLFKREGVFLGHLPRQVRLLEPPPSYAYFDMPAHKALSDCIGKGRVDMAWSRLAFGYVYRGEPNPARREQLVWTYISRTLPTLDGYYDAAVGYLEKSPIYYVVDKVRARRKLGVIHSDYDAMGMDADIDMPYFKALDYIAGVSESSSSRLAERFPMYKDKIVLLQNIVSPETVRRLAEEPVPLDPDNIAVVSVGRLHPAKGFKLAIEACELLVRDGYKLKWYIVGEGEERGSLERLIAAKGLQGSVILAGMRENPYPFIGRCDIYAQTSLYEGRCLTLTEAKILRKPIVSTDFAAVYDQLRDGHNGLIVGKSAADISAAVKRLIDDEQLRLRFKENLTQEGYGTEEEVGKLYRWIG